MTFFNKKKLRPRPIEIDRTAISSNSPEIQQRLDRIEDNYQRLDSILADVETKIRSDERLNAIDQSITEIEVEVDGRKRKWRSRKTKTKPKRKSAAKSKSAAKLNSSAAGNSESSADPKKPR